MLDDGNVSQAAADMRSDAEQRHPLHTAACSDSANNLDTTARSMTSRRRLQPALKRRKTKRNESSSDVALLGSASRVKDIHVDFSSIQCSVELPSTAKPGDRYFVEWPKTMMWSHKKPRFMFECPQSLGEVEGTATPQHILVVAPSAIFDPMEKKRRVVLRRSAAKFLANIGKSSVQVGGNYQVDQIPPVGHGEHRRGNLVDDPREAGEQLWDDNKAREAMKRGEDVEDFLGEASDLNSKILRMKALHKCNYYVRNARLCLTRLLETEDDIPIVFDKEQAGRININPAFLEMDFRKASADMGKSVCACIVHYYNWKKSPAYLRLKHRLCSICDEGGKLLMCFQCRDAYHLVCAGLSNKNGPKDVWLCGKCLQSPAAKLRKRPPIDLEQESVSPMKRLRVMKPQSKAVHRCVETPQLSPSKLRSPSHLKTPGYPLKAGKPKKSKLVMPMTTPPERGTSVIQFASYKLGEIKSDRITFDESMLVQPAEKLTGNTEHSRSSADKVECISHSVHLGTATSFTKVATLSEQGLPLLFSSWHSSSPDGSNQYHWNRSDDNDHACDRLANPALPILRPKGPNPPFMSHIGCQPLNEVAWKASKEYMSGTTNGCKVGVANGDISTVDNETVSRTVNECVASFFAVENGLEAADSPLSITSEGTPESGTQQAPPNSRSLTATDYSSPTVIASKNRTAEITPASLAEYYV